MFEMKTSRLIIEGPKIAEFPDYWRLLTEAPIAKRTNGGTTLTYEEAEKKYQQKCLLFQKSGNHDFSVTDFRQNQYVGYCGVDYTPELQAYELLFAFFPEGWQQGYVKEAITAVVEFSKNILQLDQLIGLISPEHHDAIAIMNELNFICTTSQKRFGETYLSYQQVFPPQKRAST